MNNILKNIFIGERKPCPYKHKCYRKNPVHFIEMSHPHFEKLIINQLDEVITIPDNIGFECSDKSLLLDQLIILQMVLKNSKNFKQKSHFFKNSDSTTVKTNFNCNDSEETDLKSKIECHKYKNELFESAKSETDIFIRKRTSSIENIHCLKKFVNTKNKSSIISSSSNISNLDVKSSNMNSLNKYSISNKSYIDYFISSDRIMRAKIRDNTILRIKQAGHKIYLCTPGEFAIKYTLSAPYYHFLSCIQKSEKTHNQEFSVSFPELLDISLGEIVDSLHINFMVEIGWLCLQYLLAAQNPKMTILCGSVNDPQTSLPANINLIVVNMPTIYGCHHSKISVFKYSDNGIRIIISTANLYNDDWENRTQGIWISPHLPQLHESANSSDGDSITEFKMYFKKYLTTYNYPQMRKWEQLIDRADFSAVNVFFVASVPGSHTDFDLNCWGHRRLATIFTEHVALSMDAPEWTLVAQCSSIGSLGPNYENWLSSNIIESMSKEKKKKQKNPNFNLIYPSLEDYKKSFDYITGSCCLPYSRKIHEKQGWLQNYFCHWKADQNTRTKAMPHIKSYTRISQDCTKISWFILTSANLSKAAWGTNNKKKLSHYIMNYEAGILFLPEFIINQTVFPIRESNVKIPVFRLPYDLPLSQYRKSDVPFIIDLLKNH